MLASTFQEHTMFTNMLAMCTSTWTRQPPSGKLPPPAALHKTGQASVGLGLNPTSCALGAGFAAAGATGAGT